MDDVRQACAAHGGPPKPTERIDMTPQQLKAIFPNADDDYLTKVATDLNGILADGG